MELTKT